MGATKYIFLSLRRIFVSSLTVMEPEGTNVCERAGSLLSALYGFEKAV
jgi:hypothetical protein